MLLTEWRIHVLSSRSFLLRRETILDRHELGAASLLHLTESFSNAGCAVRDRGAAHWLIWPVGLTLSDWDEAIVVRELGFHPLQGSISYKLSHLTLHRVHGSQFNVPGWLFYRKLVYWMSCWCIAQAIMNLTNLLSCRGCAFHKAGFVFILVQVF